jgi:hypothetical protein
VSWWVALDVAVGSAGCGGGGVRMEILVCAAHVMGHRHGCWAVVELVRRT